MLIFSRFRANLFEFGWLSFPSFDVVVVLCDKSLKTLMWKVQTNRSDRRHHIECFVVKIYKRTEVLV